MTDVSDLYEPGDDREPDEPEQEEAEPIDLDAVGANARAAVQWLSLNNAPTFIHQTVDAVFEALAELRRDRERLAYWRSLPLRSEYAVTANGGVVPGEGVQHVRCESAEEAEELAGESGGAAWARSITEHPYQEIQPPPF